MIQLFEDNNVTSANCNISTLDEPFYIPIKRNDPLYFRVQIPYQYVTLNGGGIPTGNILVKLVKVDGTTLLCDYGDETTNKFKFGYTNDSTNRIAEYQFFTGIGMADEGFNNYSVYSIDVSANDIVQLTVGTTEYSFVYGIDEIPFPLWECDAGKIAIILNLTEYGSTTLLINGSSDTLASLIGVPTCAHEDYQCFRIKVEIELVTYGETITFISKPYKIIRCDDPSVWLMGKYPSGQIDCAGHKHEASGNAFYKNLLFLRIIGELDDFPSEIQKVYNERSYNYKSTIIKRKVLRGEPIPSFYQDAFETLMLAKETRVDGVQLYAKDVSAFTEKIDINGVSFQNINLPLQLSKCENIFVC